jgi:outer membrane protein assembly factor BamB
MTACTAHVENSDGASSAAQSLKKGKGHDKAWSMAAYDVVGSSHNAAEHKIDRDNVTDLSIKWRFDAADAGHEVGPVHATPVVDNGKVYVGSNLGRFYAIKPNGKMKWSYTARQPNPFLAAVVVPSPIGSPINAVGTPIVGAAVLPPNRPHVIFGDLDGNLYALHRETGRELG